MTKTTNQHRTAGSILEGIKERYENELETLHKLQDEVEASTLRPSIMTDILNDAEKNGSDDE